MRGVARPRHLAHLALLLALVARVQHADAQQEPPAPSSSPVAPAATSPAPAAGGDAVKSDKPKAEKPEAKTTVFGRVQLLIWNDPQNQGDVPDTQIAPNGSLRKEWNSSVQINLLLGGRFTYPKPIAGFIASGQVRAAVEVRRIFNVNSAFVQLDNRDLGLRFGFGRFVQQTVSPLSPSTFQFSTNFYLQHATTGAYVAKSLGKLSAQLGAGRPELPDLGESIPIVTRGAPVLPFVEGRLAYIDPDHVGELPASALNGARPGPLTIGVSGGYGKQRVGVGGERAAILAIDPSAVDPRIEDVTSWLVSAEIILPFLGFTLAGEAYQGTGANQYQGAFRQRPHVDPMTGRHTALSSRGAWLQLSYAFPGRWTALAFGGFEEVTSGLDVGIPTDVPTKIEANRMIMASFAKNFDIGMHAGIQVQHHETRYLGANTGDAYAVLAESSINF